MKQMIKLNKTFNNQTVYGRVQCQFGGSEVHVSSLVILELMLKEEGFNFKPLIPHTSIGPHYSVIKLYRLQDWHNITLVPNEGGVVSATDIFHTKGNKEALSNMLNSMLSKTIKKSSIRRLAI